MLMYITLKKNIPFLGTSTHNGVSKGSSSQPGKPKPGTVAAALEEKKKAAAAAAAAEAASKASSNHDQEALNPANPTSGLLQDKTKDNPTNQVQDSSNIQETPMPMPGTDLTITPSVAQQQNGGSEKVDIPATDLQNNTSEIMTKTIDNAVEGTDNDGSTKGGLTSEERVLLREKKKARLQKEQEQNNQNITESSLDGTDPNDGHSSIAEGSDVEGEPGSEPKRRTRSGRPIGQNDNNADNDIHALDQDSSTIENSA